MKPTVIANANANASASAGSGPNPNGITIPINHDYNGPPPHQQSQHPQYHTQAQHYVGGGDPHSTAYGSPGSHARAQQQQYPQQQQPQQQQQQPHPQQQQIPAHFQQDFDFDNDMGMDMFPRSRLGRMAHDPFADFSASHFGFPQFNSLGRRRANNTTHDDDFFNRLPTEFRQYIPDSFGHRRATAGGMPSTPGTPGVHPHPQPHQHPHPHPQAQPQQPQQQQHHQPMPAHFYQTLPPQSPSKKVCDAAIQTEDPNSGRSEVDHAVNMDNLNQHGLRNTMDMGVKSATENETAGIRSHSAPPNEPLLQQQVYHPQQQTPVNGQRQTPPVQQHPQGGRPQFGTQTSPPVQTGGFAGQAPQFHKAYYAPQSQTHPQQKQQTPPPPQTPGGSYIRTIPIFVEGRAEPIINNKEIPNQNAAPNTSASGRAFTPPKQQQPFQYPQPPQAQAQAQPQQQQQQQHRPTPLNTQNQQQQPQQQQQQQQQSTGLPPQTPHTVDSINKIQDIQRDVLALMSCVEQFTGRRADKEYAYLDEMLTRNLLKLDNIDTNGKESIRLARKEAIKCIQASINVLEAKAEENTKAALANANAASAPLEAAVPEAAETPQKSSSGAKVTKDPSQTKLEPQQQPDEPVDASKIQEPIPLPPPEGMLVESKAETTAETVATGEESKEKETENEATPVPEKTAAETPEAKAEATAEAAAAPAPAPAVDIAAAAETK